MFPKKKPIRLSGAKLRKLNELIHERDDHKCVVCGAYVEPGIKFHHEPPGINKQDVESGGVLLCPSCHYHRHNSSNSLEIKSYIIAYLQKLYTYLNLTQ